MSPIVSHVSHSESCLLLNLLATWIDDRADLSHVSYSESCLLQWVMSPIVSRVSYSESCLLHIPTHSGFLATNTSNCPAGSHVGHPHDCLTTTYYQFTTLPLHTTTLLLCTCWGHMLVTHMPTALLLLYYYILPLYYYCIQVFWLQTHPSAVRVLRGLTKHPTAPSHVLPASRYSESCFL